MKIASWNVNSVNARLERILQFLEKSSPSVLTLQELKCEDSKFPFETFQNLGFDCHVLGQKRYNGVAILAKKELESTVVIPDFDQTPFGQRLIGATIGNTTIFCAYAPNGGELETEPFQRKLDWYEKLHYYLSSLLPNHSNLFLCGDFNIVPTPLDSWAGDKADGEIFHTEVERAALQKVLNLGFTDLVRKFQATDPLFSWWDYRQLAFPKNRGLRIDFALATPKVAEICSQAWIDRDERKGAKPSDHVPVIAEFPTWI